MASRAGPRAAGTDGSDFSHREKIVNHYKVSADLKKSVQKCLIPHMLIAVLYVAKQVAVFLGSTYFQHLVYWEQIWLISGFCAFIAFGGMPKNDMKRLWVYIIGNLFFGLIPLFLGALELVNQVQIDFKDVKKVPVTWKNSPMKMAMIAVCISWQVSGLVQGFRLLNTWKSMSGKKKDS